MKPHIKIDVVSDVVCPWCYIGKRRMERAVVQLADSYEFEVNYLPFELMPDMPAEGRDTRTHLVAKFGSEQRYQEIVNHVTQIAAEEGLNFDLFHQDRSPNTRSLHRVIGLAQREGKQLEAVEAYFKAYFEDRVDLTNLDNVVQIAESVGLEGEKVRELLNGSEGEEQLEEILYQNHQMGVRGVPYYIINNQYAISGAQPTEVFLEALPEIATKAPLAGEVCDVETGEC